MKKKLTKKEVDWMTALEIEELLTEDQIAKMVKDKNDFFTAFSKKYDSIIVNMGSSNLYDFGEDQIKIKTEPNSFISAKDIKEFAEQFNLESRVWSRTGNRKDGQRVRFGVNPIKDMLYV